MLSSVFTSSDIVVYKIEEENESLLNRYIVSSLETREICNDPQICGIEYTGKLQHICTKVLEAFPFFSSHLLYENQGIVVNIMRSGLSFGIREALADAYQWNNHQTLFIHSKHGKMDNDSENWLIQKDGALNLQMPNQAQLILGDVIATGANIQYTLNRLIKNALQGKTSITNIVILTFGSRRSEAILSDIAQDCREHFKEFESIDLIYFEGRFMTPDHKTTVTIKKTDTDLLRKGALMAPEFLASQYELPFYALERCTIYDAGFRAYDIKKYMTDVIDYWEETKKMASRGFTFEELIKERFPEIDATKFGKQNLLSLAEQHITKLKRIIAPKPGKELLAETKNRE